MDDSNVDHHAAEGKIAILMFSLLAIVVILGSNLLFMFISNEVNPTNRGHKL